MVLDERRNWLHRKRCRLFVHHSIRGDLLLSLLHARLGVKYELLQPFDRRVDYIRGPVLVLAAAGLRGTEVCGSRC